MKSAIIAKVFCTLVLVGALTVLTGCEAETPEGAGTHEPQSTGRETPQPRTATPVSLAPVSPLATRQPPVHLRHATPRSPTPWPTRSRLSGSILAPDRREPTRGPVRTAPDTSTSQERDPPPGEDPRDGREDWFTRRVPAEDRECLSHGLRNDHEARQHLEGLGDQSRAILDQCLSPAGRIAVHILERAELAGEYATEACIQRGSSVEIAGRAREPKPPYHDVMETAETARARDARGMARQAVSAYCSTPADDNAERRILACLVSRVGGPDRFMAAHLERSTVLEEFARARRGEGPCAASR